MVNSSTTLMPRDLNKELALEGRVMQFGQTYLRAAEPKTPLVLDERGETHLRSLLYEAGYLREEETPVYRRLSVEKQTGRPVIDVFEFRDVLAKEEGFSYICLNNQDEFDAYVGAREKRYANNSGAGAAFGMALAGGVLVGGLVDAIAGKIALDSLTWNPSAWWLLAPPTIAGAIGYAIGNAIEQSGEETLAKDTTSFREHYAHRISTGPEAILKAFGYTPPTNDGVNF